MFLLGAACASACGDSAVGAAHGGQSATPDAAAGVDAAAMSGSAALARANAARLALDTDWGVGIEGGVVEQPDGSMRTCAWAVIVDATGKTVGDVIRWDDRIAWQRRRGRRDPRRE